MAESKSIKKRKSRKTLTNSAGGDQKDIELPQRIFLYLQPKSISFPSDHDPFDKVEIEVEHQKNIITKLSDHYETRNIINVEQFDVEKPTFSITIEQDSIEDVTCIGDTPIVLTLYIYKLVDVATNEEDQEEEDPTPIEERIPVAQGYIDIMGYFKKRRSKSTETIYLYPLEISADALTCKTEWDIYSLHPLIKNTTFSNVVLISLGSLYNMNEYFLEDCENLVANLSFLSRIPNENNEYDKIFFCKYTAFSKSIISDQNLSKKWENLKNKPLNNLLCMGIAFDSNFTLSKLLYNLLATENVEFRYDDINFTVDYALICNSMHRYILTEHMQRILETALSTDQYQIIMEIYSERDESKILLQGFVDLSIFMYPEVKCCSYAIELKPPHALRTSKATVNNDKRKSKKKSSASSREQSVVEEKIPFAVLQICLNKPITSPTEDLTELSVHKLKRDKCDQCSRMPQSTKHKQSLTEICEENYIDFYNLVREILNHMIRNNIKTIGDDKDFFCAQLGNMTNKIMKLVACDFNIRIPTKTNIEFTNLTTTVYGELVDKIYECIKKCSVNSMKNCFIDSNEAQKIIINRMTSAKYMYEIGNIEMAEFFMNLIRDEYPNNPTFNFYNFLYDMERQNYQLAKEYLERPLSEKDPEGQLYTDIVQIYLNYKLALLDPEEAETAEENLIKELSEYCSDYCPKSIVGWILLNCLYKKHNYRAGMSYTRWVYENLYENIFVQLEFIPISRWEIYLPYKITLKSVKDQNFIKVMYQLLCLGLYDFAEWVFMEIANECLEVDKYFILNTFKIFKNDLDSKLVTKNFPVEKMVNPLHLRANVSQVNGNLEYHRDPLSPNSMIHYKTICDIQDLDCYHYYQLGILRYAYRMMDEQNYEEAGKAFLCCCEDQANCIAAVIGRGKSCYYLGMLEESEQYYGLSTKYGLYIPNTWAYLALINLKRGENYKALECWKYARLNPDNDIDEEILNELDLIDPNDVYLYVDVPKPL